MTTYTPQQAREMAGRALDHGTTARALNSLADQVEALKDDAERYRWLRDSKNWDEEGLCPIVASGEDTIYGEHLDAAIDAARAAP